MDSGFSGLAKNSQFFVRIGFLIGFWFSLDGFQMVFLGSGWFFQVLVFLGCGSGSDI
jgi:hypothetical protein